MKQFFHTMPKRLLPFLTVLVCLAASPMAWAIAIFPASVQNKTFVAVEVSVMRVQTRLGSPATTNEVKTTIQPGQRGSVMIMGGTFGTGASYTKRITISQVPNVAQPDAKPIAPPLVLDKPSSTMVREFVIDLDKAGNFTFEPAPVKPAEQKQ
jgi:hypothetical protein